MQKDIKRVVEEIEKHQKRMVYYRSKIEMWGDISEEFFENPELVETIDAFIFRFSKMQDSMGENLFPLTLSLLGEEVKKKPFIDLLNRLEELELLESAEKWIELRKLRNAITHTYPWETEVLIKLLKEALKQSRNLERILENFKTFLRDRGLI